MKPWLSLLLVFALAACAAPTAQDIGPPPAGYQGLIKQNIIETFHDPYTLHNVSISDPQPGREKFIPGWRVCVRADGKNKAGDYTGVTPYGFFFPSSAPFSTFGNLTIEDPHCADYSYKPWPEMENMATQVYNLPHNQWSYMPHHDELKQIDAPFAMLESDNGTMLKFPYNGGTHGFVSVIKTPTDTTVSIGLDRGQIDCRKKSCGLQVRFDDDPIETVPVRFDDKDNHSSVTVIDGARFLDRLKTSTKLVVEIDIPHNGNRQFLFSPPGLDFNKIGTRSLAPFQHGTYSQPQPKP